MSTPDTCKKCGMSNLYPDGELIICADCGYEHDGQATSNSDAPMKVKDAYGNTLQDGDSVLLIKDLKLKGGDVLKLGTKVRNIRLVEGDHDIDCKIDGIGMMLKSQFVKKA
jgi:protein PhnA